MYTFLKNTVTNSRKQLSKLESELRTIREQLDNNPFDIITLSNYRYIEYVIDHWWDTFDEQLLKQLSIRNV
jgi:hypothetical protein